MANDAKLKEARDRLSRIGKTQSDIARELNVELTVVQGVLSGRLKGAFGSAHKVAVALGLKDGIVLGEGQSVAEAIRAAAA